MKAVGKKLNSAQGASMLIALLYLLAALMAGTVALVAASNNAGRVSHNRQEQREYYAVASAAALIRADMEDECFEAWYGEETAYEWIEATGDADAGTLVPGYYNPTGTTYPHDSSITAGGLLKELEDGLARRYFSGAVYSGVSTMYGAPVSVECELSFAGTELPEVKGKLSVNMANYDITFELWTEGEDSAKNNPLTLYFEADAQELRNESGSESDGSVTTLYEFSLQWREPEITKGVTA